MNWEKREMTSIEKVIGVSLTLSTILILIGLASNRPLILIPAGFVMMYAFVNWHYNKRIGSELIVENPVRSVRLFEGEESELNLAINNHSPIPYFNSLLSFTTNTKIDSTKHIATSSIHKNFFQLPLTIAGKSSLSIKLPIKATKRGIVRVSELELTFPHLFNFENVSLSYLHNYKTEIIIYPRLEPVHGIKDFPYQKYGNHLSRYSPFEDQQNIMGTKEYVSSDSFRRIHWKASAKNQILQSKVFERNVHISWTIILNLTVKSPLGNLYLNQDAEKFLSQAAYISQSILQKGYPLELYMNLISANNRPIHAELGQGREQLKKIYELLARVEETERMMKLENILYWVDNKMIDSNLIVIIGELDESGVHSIHKWLREGRKVFWVNNETETGYLEEMNGQRLKHDVS